MQRFLASPPAGKGGVGGCALWAWVMCGGVGGCAIWAWVMCGGLGGCVLWAWVMCGGLGWWGAQCVISTHEEWSSKLVFVLCDAKPNLPVQMPRR